MSSLVSALEFFIRLVAKTPFLSMVFKRCYLAGTKKEDLKKVVPKLTARNIGCAVDILGEHVTEMEEAEAVFKEYLALANWIYDNRHLFDGVKNPYGKSISIKATHFGLMLNFKACLKNVRALVARAKEKGVFVWIDAEEKETLGKAHALAYRVNDAVECNGNVGIAIQSCHTMATARVKECVAEKVPVRLCRGAYTDGDIQDGEKLRAVIRGQAKTILLSGLYLAFAVHDENDVGDINGFALEQNISKDKYEIQMLYGVRMGLQEKLAREHYRVICYLPFGGSYRAYLNRRFQKGFRSGVVSLFMRNALESFIFSLKPTPKN